MKKAILAILMFCFISSLSSVYARSGCCSHHDGVCGCGCCDGSSLSAKCLPYYPQCTGGESAVFTSEPTNPPAVTVIVATSTPWPTITPTNTPIPKVIATFTPAPIITFVPPTFTPTPEIVAVKGSTDSGIGGIVTLALLGGGSYWFLKGKKQKSS